MLLFTSPVFVPPHCPSTPPLRHQVALALAIHGVSAYRCPDRELTLVPKKGRPVTQCQHCRLERKKRSAHVKCDCGEVEKPHHPKEKCIHLREAEERAKAGFHEEHHDEKDPAHLAAVAEEQGCCCHHGGKCTCSFLKKESESSDDCTPHGPAVPKPRLDTTRSDGSITVFANGHHKPVHRKNHAAHECGMPYKMPAPRHENGVATAARRSVDSLALKDNVPYNPCNIQLNRGSSSLSNGSRTTSAQPSPSGPHGLTNPRLSSLDFTSLAPVQTNNSIDTTASDSMVFPPFDPMSGLADGQYDPWSVYPSSDSNHLPNNNPFSAWPTTFDNSGATQPALTAASSGTQSEADEIPTMDDLYNFPMPSIQEGFDVDSTMGDNLNSNRHSLPPGFFGNADFSLPAAAGDYQTPVGSVRDSDSTKARNDQSLGFFDAWQSPTMPTMANMAQRTAATTSNPGRPQSQSVGPASAPNDDLIRQLFPDIDITNSPFGAGNSPTVMQSGKGFAGAPTTIPTSGSMDMTSSYAPQGWNDGSMSVPNDDFPSPFGLSQNFSTEDFGWGYN